MTLLVGPNSFGGSPSRIDVDIRNAIFARGFENLDEGAGWAVWEYRESRSDGVSEVPIQFLAPKISLLSPTLKGYQAERR
jgi:hypothetical protein